DTEKHKPHPEPLLVCLEGLHATKNEAVYIGDSIYDMQCANSAGVKFALALWGSKTTNGFESADYVLNAPKDILNII
ncbi:MAG: HAD hydrolase-like protein, partial [Lysinibacillus sp.]